MAIFAIRRDGYDYQELDLEVDDFIENLPEDVDYNTIHDFSLENLALAKYWKPLRTGFSEIKGKKNIIPDISNWINATLFLSPKAYRLLNELLAPFGEFLPVIIGDDTYYIFNCLTAVEAQNSNESITFNESSLTDKIVFKTPNQHCIDIFCTDRLKNAIEDFELKGIVFDTKI